MATAREIRSKQIKKFITGWVNVPSFTYPASTSSANVTSYISAALLTAGNNNTPVSLTSSTSELSFGVITSGANNSLFF